MFGTLLNYPVVTSKTMHDGYRKHYMGKITCYNDNNSVIIDDDVNHTIPKHSYKVIYLNAETDSLSPYAAWKGVLLFLHMKVTNNKNVIGIKDNHYVSNLMIDKMWNDRYNKHNFRHILMNINVEIQGYHSFYKTNRQLLPSEISGSNIPFSFKVEFASQVKSNDFHEKKKKKKFWMSLLPILEEKGWLHVIMHREVDNLFFPPNVRPSKSNKIRIHYFNTVKSVLIHVKSNNELMNDPRINSIINDI